MNELNHLDDSGPNTFLLIGIGNSGRGDDGLGWAFVEAIEQKGNFRGRTVLRYQLQVEDADLISQYDQVIFVDAHQGDLERGFSFKKCAAEKEFSFTTHHLAPETIVFLCQELYQKKPNVLGLIINGRLVFFKGCSFPDENLRKVDGLKLFCILISLGNGSPAYFANE